jgi:hypothetical protein
MTKCFSCRDYRALLLIIGRKGFIQLDIDAVKIRNLDADQIFIFIVVVN